MRMVCQSDFLSQQIPQRIAARLQHQLTGYRSYLLAGRGYDTDNVVCKARDEGMKIVPLQRKIALNNAITISISIGCDTWLRMHF